MKIKLIVDYSFQIWDGSNYQYPQRSVIMTFENKNNVTNGSILDKLKLIHKISNFDILKITKI